LTAFDRYQSGPVISRDTAPTFFTTWSQQCPDSHRYCWSWSFPSGWPCPPRPGKPTGNPAWTCATGSRRSTTSVSPKTASTLRARISITSPEWSGWQLNLAGHANRHLGAEDFNSTANGRSNYPTVADPDDEGLSEAWIGYRRGAHFSARFGRQRLTEDNLRFLGNVGFRQLEQTFDALTMSWQPTAEWRMKLRWLDRAHRIFGPSNPNGLLAEAALNAWLGTLERDFGATTAALYVHRVGYDDRAASHRNFGLRLTGDLPGDHGLSWRLAYVRQDGIRQLDGVDAQDYVHARLAHRLDDWHWFAGHERMSGDGHYSFQTPLATLHAHNGWSDQFLSTPADGLVDTYAAAGATLGDWTGLVKVHDFRPERNSYRYGNEYGLMLVRSLPAGLGLEFKAARFAGRDRADVTKIWLSLTASW